ncbi:MAG TPA: aminoglycoside adenylyltransferase domain-containing protein [Gemmatimonadaceae bacterium]
MSASTPYPELNTVLAHFLRELERVLSDNFVGAYLQGSFAVGDFDEHSDVDFVVVTIGEVDDDLPALQRLHANIFDLPSEWAKHLEGSYFPAETLRRADTMGSPLWYLDHGSRSLIRSNHCNTLVVRSILREHGVVVAGPSTGELVRPVSAEALRREIRATMVSWGRQVLNDPAPYRNRFYQGYLILNYARMLHDLREGRPGSKLAGAEWAKAALGGEWHDLIDRAWSTRPNPAVSVRTPPDSKDFERTLSFVKLCIEQAELPR